MSRVHVALRDMPNRCADCGCRIDHGDSYEIRVESAADGSPIGFDYIHHDCTQTAYKGALERDRP